MRLPLALILPVLILDILVDWYICRAVARRTSPARPLWRRLAVWSSVVLTLFLVAIVIWPKKSADDSDFAFLMWGLYAYFSIYIPKYIFVIFDLLASVPRLFHASRLRLLSWTGILLGVLTFGAMWWGALINRFRIDVREVDFADSRVPEAFDGFKVVQISDIHTGTYGDDTTFVASLVDAVNALEPDLVLFTGDIVNRRSTELEPFTSVLSRLKAPSGVMSVLGNHDYGDYFKWQSDSAKAADRRHLADLQRALGWDLLNNDTRYIYKEGRHGQRDSIAIVGVENIGDPPFPVYGDLDAAYPGDLADDVFKILMSHNPAHWTADIADAPDKNIPLTLSGHTHAMQIELAGISPAALRYSTWGGRYDDADSTHTLYVNIGTGEVGVPARIGATPEVTLFTLRRGQ